MIGFVWHEPPLPRNALTRLKPELVRNYMLRRVSRACGAKVLLSRQIRTRLRTVTG